MRCNKKACKVRLLEAEFSHIVHTVVYLTILGCIISNIKLWLPIIDTPPRILQANQSRSSAAIIETWGPDKTRRESKMEREMSHPWQLPIYLWHQLPPCEFHSHFAEGHQRCANWATGSQAWPPRVQSVPRLDTSVVSWKWSIGEAWGVEGHPKDRLMGDCKKEIAGANPV